MKYSPPDYWAPEFGLAPASLRTIEYLHGGSKADLRRFATLPATASKPERARFVYKFLKFDASDEFEVKKVRDILVGGTLYLSSLKNLNDPDEARMKVAFDQDPVVVRRWIERNARLEARKVPKGTRRSVREKFQRDAMDRYLNDPDLVQRTYDKSVGMFGIFCFSTDPRSGQLWAHYANGHRGICIRFDRLACLGVLTPTMTVDYTDEVPRIEWPGEKNRVMEGLQRKSTEWAYESEVRYISRTTREAPIAFDARAAVGVIVGRRFGEQAEQVTALERLLAEREERGLKRPDIFKVVSFESRAGHRIARCR